MVQTLARNLDQLPTLDLLVIDEAHHSAAPTYRQVIDTTLGQKSSCADLRRDRHSQSG